MKKLTTEQFIERAKQIHNNTYQYGKTIYKSAKKNVTITCPIHGDFEQAPDNHLHGQGCPICRYIKSSKAARKPQSKFIEEAKQVHGDRYDYSKVDYRNNRTKVCIICHKKDKNGNEHGEFWQTPYKHILRKQGCPRCSGNAKRTTEQFVADAKKIHGGENLDYSKVKYHGIHEKVCIICPKHGEFWQAPNDHLRGQSCPVCHHTVSKAENDIYNFICSFIDKDEIIRHDKSTLPNHKELDIYIPSHHMAIEYNGLIWHSEKFNKDKFYHLSKLEECNKLGIKLISIFEDEWLTNRKIVLNKIKHILGFNNNKRVYARKCIIMELDNKKIADDFLNKNHIQGQDSSSVKIGGFNHDRLVGVMTFVNEGNGKWNLSRFATDNDLVCVGLASKLFAYFIKKYNPLEVKSFADRRWTVNKSENLYTKMGFNLDKVLPPNYKYTKNGMERIHKFNFRKNKIHQKYDLPLSMTEYEMTQKLGFWRVWDCGLLKYVWKKHSV